MDLLKDLNDEQREAVRHTDGPLLIIAGAGTGKTKVITHRIARLVESGVKPQEILALTFTDKAASEMEERVDRLLPYGTFGVQISTFHAFGDRVLRENGLEIGLTTDFRVLTRPEQVIFMREHLFEFPLSYYRPLGNPTKFIDAILTLISRAKDEDVTPGEYLRYAEGLANLNPPSPPFTKGGDVVNLPLKKGNLSPDGDKGGFSDDPKGTTPPSPLFSKEGEQENAELAIKQMELARTYVKYQELMERYGYLDFGDLVNTALRLFRERSSVLAEYRRRFRYIMVDEFQDTNFAQFQMVKLLAGGHSNVAVVGDDDQSIYKFRGAAISNIMNFMEIYPGARQVVLSRNYRSTRQILDSAYTLITHNNPDRLEVKNNINKRLSSDVGEGEEVGFRQFETLHEEADWVASSIEEGIGKGMTPGNFAVLVRNNSDADPFSRALNARGIPNRFSGNRGLYGRPEVRLLISFLRVMANPSDSVNLFNLAISEVYDMDMAGMTLCLNLAHRRRRPLFQILSNLDGLEEITEDGRAAIAEMMEGLRGYMGLSRELTSGSLLYRFITDGGYLAGLASQGTPQSDEKIRNIARFFEMVKEYEGLTPNDRVFGFVEHLNHLIEAGDDPPVAEAGLDADAVNILTIHKAKGLEFPVVFMVGLAADRFPARNRPEQIELPKELIKDRLSEGDFHMEEERRLFYVGMTRGMRRLHLSYSRDCGGKRLKKPSPFIQEALDITVPEGEKKKGSAAEAIERAAAFGASPDAREVPIPESETLNLSFYQIDDYDTCPLKYRYVHILKVPILENQAVIYGKALHDAVQAYLRGKKAGRPLSAAEAVAVYERSWKGEGFHSREHEELRFEAGKRAVERFVEVEESDKGVPTHIEKEFSFFIGNNRLSGRWDRVDEEGESVIIDYKSSEVREQKDADKKAKESLQLSIYAMAYRAMEGRLPDRVELHFLESGLTGSSVRDDKELKKAEEKIIKVADGIRRREFPATPGYMSCGYCAFRDICPYTGSEE